MAHIPPPTTIPPGSIVDAYLRDSGGPRQEASTEQQLAEIVSYCQQYGLALRNKFIDVAQSGGSTVSREAFNKLIDTSRSPETRPHALLLWNYARFARDLDDAIYYKALLRNRDVIIHSLTDPIPEGQYGRIVEFFIDISNEEKRRQTSSDAKRGLRELVLKHGCVPGVPPTGFKREVVDLGTRRDGSSHTAHKWVPDPELVPRIQRAFQMRTEGSSLAQIHDELGLLGSINSYKTFFANRIYIGILEFGDLVVENYCEPMIDMETWNQVQKIIQDYAAARVSERHPRRADSPYLLSGLVYCADCDSPLAGNTTTRTHITGRDEAYRCSRSKRHAGCTAGRIGRRTLEDAVLYTLREYILLPDSMVAMFNIEQTAQEHRETRRTERLAVLAAEKKRLATQITNITRAIAERGHTQALLDKLTELEARRATVTAEHTQLTNTRIIAAPALAEDQVIALAKSIVEELTSGPSEEVRQLLSSFIFKIRVKKHETGQISGSITYFTPTKKPPPDLPQSENLGYNLPIGRPPVGAPRFTHTIEVNIPIYKKPRSR